MTRQVRDRIITQRQGLAVPKHASQVGFTAQRQCEQTRITMTVKGGGGVQHGQRKIETMQKGDDVHPGG